MFFALKTGWSQLKWHWMTCCLLQFTAGELSRADGVGFVFSQRLPCAKLTHECLCHGPGHGCLHFWRRSVMWHLAWLRCQKHTKNRFYICLGPKLVSRRPRKFFMKSLHSSQFCSGLRLISVAAFACGRFRRLKGLSSVVWRADHVPNLKQPGPKPS